MRMMIMMIHYHHYHHCHQHHDNHHHHYHHQLIMSSRRTPHRQRCPPSQLPIWQAWWAPLPGGGGEKQNSALS